jgi:hypothetical protein
MTTTAQSGRGKKLVVGTLLALMVLMPVPAKVEAATVTPEKQSQLELIAYLTGVLIQLQAQLAMQQSDVASVSPSANRNTTSFTQRNPYKVLVLSLNPISVGRGEATLRGELDKGSSEYVDAWFEYGAGSSLNRRSDVTTINKKGRKTIDILVDSLSPNTKYSYRLVVEDADGYRQYAPVNSFVTVEQAKSQNFTGLPDVEADGVSNIKSSGARLHAFVTMNDYSEGQVFFVYGTDRTLISEIDDYDKYEEIPVPKTGFKKKIAVKIFSGRDNVYTDVGSLARATKYYYRACAAVPEEFDGFRCSDTSSFTTLN